MQKKLIKCFVFWTIDFDKVYDRIEWNFILRSFIDMGLNPLFIIFVQTLFGNARARVSMNRRVSSPFNLYWSMRKGSPLALLLYTIVADALSFLVENIIMIGKV